eukprot:CAMPEP_0113959190 /NCGR_PEP_ID=MMETSP0011_2-20120614/4001_1 /TAXON_ID=101924 /ORGANISM="Rhodosorus marinus" /LENGTH=270 /DNA_ID=CAMNT_0000970463 /DNA_START=1408 /DNA_END=2220 /DNA_ORIENTATION=- /assembly_acc=CAM_ASM_000156
MLAFPLFRRSPAQLLAAQSTTTLGSVDRRQGRRDDAEVLGTLLDEPLDPEAAPDRDLILAQLALPLRLGGFGVADRGLVCSPAAVASWATALRTLVSFRMRSACRHSRFKYILSESLTRVGHTVEVESELPRSVSETAPPRCIADLLVSDAAARRSTYVDLAITCPVASAHLTAAASALRRVKERRYAKSMASLPRAEGRSHRFQPLIVESFGHAEKSGLEWLRKCFAEHHVEYLELLRRLSVSLWRYSSSMLAQARYRRLGLQASLPSS